MIVKVKTKAKAKWSRKDRDMTRAAVHYAAEVYGLPSWGKVIVKLCAHVGEHGSAINLDDQTFMVHVSAGDEEQVLKTVFHEMWHVYQYIAEGLNLEGNKAVFRREHYDIDVTTCDEDTYWNAPWEVEARQVEEKMYLMYTS